MENTVLKRGKLKDKVVLISIDGMRPDGLRLCGAPELGWLETHCAYTYGARTVFPPVTLPCHFSMMHSVSPQRHGILTNTYVPQVRPIDGIFERIKAMGGMCAMYYGWEPLRDIYQPKSVQLSRYLNAYMVESSDTELTDWALEDMDAFEPDFVFLYMVETDEKGGHDNGWMSEEYLRRIRIAIGNARRVIEQVGSRYHVVITADHGGHDRTHGADLPEDMTIPMFFYGKRFTPGQELEQVSLLDLAPTVASLMNIPCVEEWEGRALC